MEKYPDALCVRAQYKEQGTKREVSFRGEDASVQAKFDSITQRDRTSKQVAAFNLILNSFTISF